MVDTQTLDLSKYGEEAIGTLLVHMGQKNQPRPCMEI